MPPLQKDLCCLVGDGECWIQVPDRAIVDPLRRCAGPDGDPQGAVLVAGCASFEIHAFLIPVCFGRRHVSLHWAC